MSKVFVTITGTNFRYGSGWLNKGDEILLIKEPDNKYDPEAIEAIVEPMGRIGYVANSVKTVVGDCYSAGRLYDKMGDLAVAKVKYILDDGSVICKVKDGVSDK